MSRGIESGEWRGERRGDMEGEQREGERWVEREGSVCLLGRGGVRRRVGGRRAILRIVPDVWNKL